MRRNITRRTQDRIHRLAYDLADIAMRARADGLDYLANSLQSMSSTCGNLARTNSYWGLDDET